MMVVLGELGGKDEYSLVEALKQGKVQKPIVAWVSGTCARLFKSEVQFGHAVSFGKLLGPPRPLLRVSVRRMVYLLSRDLFFLGRTGCQEWW